jgi:hypothetical protein
VIHNNRHSLTRPFKENNDSSPLLATRQVPKGDIVNSYKKIVIASNYTVGNPLFIDRTYFDQIGDKRLEGLFQILMQRHQKGVVVINAKKDLIVYRLVSLNNNNQVFDDYEETDIKVKVVGLGSDHTKVLKKKFPAGVITLFPGGPTSASPILISVTGDAVPEFGFEISSTPMEPAGGIEPPTY